MEIIIYATIYIIGVFLGSFFTLATYRIPLKQDILYTRSYCPHCKNKLKTLDLIPILSYVLLGGKCRYCKEKIGARYIIIEAFSGLFYLLFVMSLKINLYNIEYSKVIYLVFATFIISTLFILGGIEKETKKFQTSVLNFGFAIEIIYIIYLYLLKVNVYRYAIYLAILLVLTILEYILKRKNNYIINILKLCIFLLIATDEMITIITIMCTILISSIKLSIDKVKNKTEGYVPIGFYLCFINMLVVMINNFTI